MSDWLLILKKRSGICWSWPVRNAENYWLMQNPAAWTVHIHCAFLLYWFCNFKTPTELMQGSYQLFTADFQDHVFLGFKLKLDRLLTYGPLIHTPSTSQLACQSIAISWIIMSITTKIWSYEVQCVQFWKSANDSLVILIVISISVWQEKLKFTNSKRPQLNYSCFTDFQDLLNSNHISFPKLSKTTRTLLWLQTVLRWSHTIRG